MITFCSASLHYSYIVQLNCTRSAAVVSTPTINQLTGGVTESPQGPAASSYPPSHPPSDFRYTFPRSPTRNFARTPHEVLLLEYRQEEHGPGEYNRKNPAGWITVS